MPTPPTPADDTTLTRPLAGEQGGPPGSQTGGRGGEAAYLIVLAGALAGEMHRLKKDVTVIGRSPEVDLRLMDGGVSRQHASIELDGDRVVLRDLSSANGTFRNGDRVTAPVVLADGDKILLGATTILKFTYQDDLEERLHRNLYESAITDSLTGVSNRRSLDERLHTEYAFSQRHQIPLALILIDLDHFKLVNDSFGHQAGDEVLRGAAVRLKALVRAEDLLARYGGEEFAVICRATDEKQAVALAERLRMSLAAAPFAIEGQSIQATISLGIAVTPAASIKNEQDLVRAADDALYQAKRSGRNRSVVFRELTATTPPDD